MLSSYDSWSEVRWAVEGVQPGSEAQALTDGSQTEDNGTGTVRVWLAAASQSVRLTIAKPGARGDGTVPEQSAWDVDEQAKFVARMTGFEHQDSYKDAAVQAVTCYSVMRLAQNEPVQ